MTKISIVCAVLVLLAGGCSSALPTLGQEQSGVAGEWSGQYAGPGGERKVFYLNLKQDGEKVAGTLSNPGGGGGSVTTDVPLSGTFKDGELVIGSFLKGTVTGNTMTGSFKHYASGRNVGFTATRSK